MSNQIEQIRAEIERRIKSWEAGVKYEGDAGDCQSRVTELTDLKKFIDQLPVEPVPAEVQEAAEKYDEKATEIALKTTSPFQEELTGPAPTYSDAFEAGAEWQRERLMKDAPVADVIDMRGSTGPFADYHFMLSLGFRKIPNTEYRISRRESSRNHRRNQITTLK